VLRVAFLCVYAYFIIAWLTHPENYYTGGRFEPMSGIGVPVALALIAAASQIPNIFSEKFNKALTLTAVLAVPLLTFLSSQYLFAIDTRQLGPGYVLLNLAIIYLLSLLGTLVTGRVRTGLFAGAGLVTAFCYIAYYTDRMRGAPILFSDFSNFGTGAGMLDNFDYTLDHRGFCFTLAIFSIHVLISKLSVRKKYAGRARVALVLCFCLGWGGLLYAAVWAQSGPLSSVSTEFSFDPMKEGYRKSGALLALVRSVRIGMVRKPKGYSDEDALRIAEASEAASAAAADARAAADPVMLEGGGDADPVGSAYRTPNIIAIMDESFTDVANIGTPVETDTDPLPFINSLSDDTIKGYAYSSGYGGGTSGSEFEFLTGNSLAFLPVNASPYQLYVQDGQPSLARTLSRLGYAGPVAIHAADRFGYNREVAYGYMGFGAFYAEENFKSPRMLRKYISDEAVFDRVITEYEKIRDDTDAPAFVWAVTMQNHSAYTLDYDNFTPDVHAVGLTAAEQGSGGEIDKVLSLMHESDRAIGELVRYFDALDEPTVVIFFGDHQPYLPDAYIDRVLGAGAADASGVTAASDATGASGASGTGDALMAKYRVPFFIHANYDIEEREIDRVSLNYLAPLAMDAAGMELTGYDRFLLKLYDQVPCITVRGHYDSDGVFYRNGAKAKDSDASGQDGLIREYNILEYNNLFDTKHRVEGFYD
jgi:phosphoglycerol transferase MdoB-like AlkP superfamily enzyme